MNAPRLLPVVGAVGALTCLAWGLTQPLSAQVEASTGAATIVVRGEVLDSNTGFPIPGAFIELVSDQLRTLSDSTGAFHFPAASAGMHQVRVSMLGYITLSEFTDVLAEDELVVWLTPKPFELEGIVVTVNRLARRRRAFPRAVRVLDPRTIQMSPAVDARDLLERLPGARTTPCGLSECVLRRGRYVELRVVIDEFRAYGGAQELVGFPTTEIHTIEYVPSCSVVRVYTKRFIERAAAQGGRNFFPEMCLAF